MLTEQLTADAAALHQAILAHGGEVSPFFCGKEMGWAHRRIARAMEELVAHVEHFLELGGEKALCLGGDLDGCGTLAAGMQGVQDMPRLWQALAARGLPQTLLEDLFWNNLRRMV